MPAREVVKVEGLTKHFPVKKRLLLSRAKSYIHAVDGVSFTVHEGEIFGLVGESGCGKTTTGKLLLKLYEPTRGSITMDGQDIVAIRRGKPLREFRRRVQMIFQDPYESLNPRMTIFDIVAEPLAVQGVRSLKEREERVAEILS